MADDSTVIPISEAKRRREAATYTPPDMPLVPALSEAHRVHLASSGLTAATVESARIYSATTRNELIALLGRTNVPRGGAIVFPFYEPGAPTPYGYRVRPDAPRTIKPAKPGGRARVIKYDQPSGDAVGVMVYYAPAALARGSYADATSVVYFTEGEKKALVLDQCGYTCVGLTGVWNWADADARRTDRTVWRLHPRIAQHVPIAGRRCVIVFDQDAHTNVEVMSAARKFAAVLLDAGAAEVGFTTPPEWCSTKGIDDYYAEHGAERLAECLADAVELSPDAADARDIPLGRIEACKGAPIPDGLVLPRMYEIGESGRVVHHTGERTAEVSPRPMLVTQYYADHASGEQTADVVFRAATGAWVTARVSRKALADPRAMVSELSPLGAPVTSVSAKNAVSWFAAYETANGSTLRVRKSSAHTGWLGTSGVFMSHESIWRDTDPDVVPSGELTRFTRVLAPRGTLDAHLVGLRRAWAASPLMRVAICAALAAPMLAPLGMRGFGVHLCGDSSRGKTTMLRVAASVYGDPDDPAWVASWNTTANAAEARAATLCDLPLFFDEVGAADPDSVQRLIYTLVNGEGRTRLTREAALRHTASWRTVVVSSGEMPMTSESMATGAQARILDLAVNGFGTLDGDSNAIELVRTECSANAGSLGCDWLAMLVGFEADDWAVLRDRRRNKKGLFLGAGRTSAVRGRVAEYAALLMVAESLAVEHFGFDPSGVDVAETLATDASETFTAGESMARAVTDWIASRPDSFPIAQINSRGSITIKGGVYSNDRCGIRVHDSDDILTEVLIIPTRLKELCTKHHKSYRAVVRDWVDRGWSRPGLNGAEARMEVRRSVEGHGQARWVSWLGASPSEN